jgi:hypothetical protein
VRQTERRAIFCGLTAQQFWAMTPREVEWWIQSKADAEMREFERLAQLACWVVNPWLDRGQKMSATKLLRRRGSTGTKE